VIFLSLFLFLADEFFSESAYPFSAAAEKQSSALFRLLTDYQSFPSSGKLGIAGLFSLRARMKRLGFGYSYYFKASESSPMGFFHLFLSCPVLEKPEIILSARYGLSTKRILFYPQNPYQTYKITAAHSSGLYTTFAPFGRKIKPYLLTGLSLTYLRGEFIEDIFQRKRRESNIYLRPKIRFGMEILFFNFEIGRKEVSFAFSYR